MNLYQGWALFCDADFLWRDDVAKLFELRDDQYAAMCVHHDHRPAEKVKMDGMIQEMYQRKNWSSLVLFNCKHPSNCFLTMKAVNFANGSFLHGFQWLVGERIGSIPEYWNWLEGYSDPRIEPKAVHYTRGIPSMKGYENSEYADEWRGYLNGNNDQCPA